MNIDPVTTEVVASRLREAAPPWSTRSTTAAIRPSCANRKDGTAGLTDKAGRVVIPSGGIQFHYTAYEQSVRALLARYPLDKLRPGESFVCNDPYKCGVPHASDFCAITPAFHGGELIGFGVSLAHKSDIGGIVPIGGAAAREIYHDGIMFPPVRYQTAQGSRSRSRRSSPTTAASPKSCSAICARRSARRASAATAGRALRRVWPRDCARSDAASDRSERPPPGDGAAAVERRRDRGGRLPRP
jgi:N-methylhydantoinase B/oxoprolinase/acetone carboxylase alpha subunit